MTCAIIDDEPLAAELLASYARKIPFLQLTGVYNSAIEAMRDLRTAPVELLFLDIQMPELSGLEFASILPPHTMIVFTTAFDRYAVDSYKVNTVDYLLKPISYDSFFAAANKAMERLEKNTMSERTSRDRFFYVKSDYKLIKINFDDILYIEGVKDYVKIVLADERKVMCLMNMKALDDFLPQKEFMRVHRSFIVHMPMTDGIDRLRITIGDNFIPVSDTYKESVLQYIDEHSIL